MTPSPYDQLEKLLEQYVTEAHSEVSMARLKKYLKPVPKEQVYQLLKTIRNHVNHTAIYVSARRGHPKVLNCLLDSVTADQKYELLSILTIDGATPLHDAAYSGHTEVVLCICNSVTAEQKYKLLTLEAALRYTVVHYAAWQGHTELLTNILDTVKPAQVLDLLKKSNAYGDDALGVALRFNKQSTADVIQDYITKAEERKETPPADGKNFN